MISKVVYNVNETIGKPEFWAKRSRLLPLNGLVGSSQKIAPGRQGEEAELTSANAGINVSHTHGCISSSLTCNLTHNNALFSPSSVPFWCSQSSHACVFGQLSPFCREVAPL